ncbi:MAG: lysylphosphatidylglycerol synthase transmembrane domain-containing protein [bacterium]|nr:lysylphosphatidylglycerol synthase transmembrane domain-containing protein [bacterium]
MEKIKSVFLLALKVSIVSGVLYYLTTQGRLNLRLVPELLNRPSLFFALFLALLLGMVFPSMVRWWCLLRALGIGMKLRKAVSVTWISIFFSTFLPGAISGDLVKAFYIRKEHPEHSKSLLFSTLLVDRILGLLAILLLAGFAIFVMQPFEGAGDGWELTGQILTGLICAFLMGGLLIIFPFSQNRDPVQRILSKLPASRITLKVHNAFTLYRDHKKTLALGLLLSLMIQLTEVLCFKLLIDQLSQGGAFTDLLAVVPIGEISTIIPVAPAGIGVGHLAFEYLFQSAGMSAGADMFTLFTLVRLIVLLLGGFPYLVYRKSGGPTMLDGPFSN